MFSRRKFLKRSSLSSLGVISTGLFLPACAINEEETKEKEPTKLVKRPFVISTWGNEKANMAAMEVLSKGGNALDAVEAGVKIPEGDAENQSVGYGGRPDRDGDVTLDSCIMDSKGNAGSVCFLQGIKHPVSVARMVMEKTPHVILAGEGAQQFALENGFKKENLLTEQSRQDWEEWKKEAKYEPIINIENHDTIGMLAIDANGDISGACTTSGLAYKMKGRVGDSPIIGAGLFVDNEIGGATATGMGEAVLKSLGSFLVVELMRQGMNPAEACKEAVMRIVRKQRFDNIQVGYLAINKKGEYGAFCIREGFVYTLSTAGDMEVIPSGFHLEAEEGKE
ncbi:MAG: N4-(beta-N-acetylglucosaminyl)-L-asparaginase [Saprospiraceae bacterium]|jgi:N4-(beta-N-acetylglucosaminyl)-L-asparaginase